jgi:hypothetical protein
VLAAGGVVTALAWIVLDPLLATTGLHRRRLDRFVTALGEELREQGDAGGNFKTPVEWPVLFICHSNPEKPPHACQTATRHL